MSSPARSISSDEEDTNHLTKLKVKYEAKMGEAEEKKTQKEWE